MPIADFCETNVATMDCSALVADAAKIMRERHVGDVVICGREEGRVVPVGILTDRDIVVGLIAKDISPSEARVEDVMTPTLVTVTGDMGVYETIQLMERYGVRRLPVVDKDGTLLGIVSSGDLLELLSLEMISLSRLSERQRLREKEIRV